MRIGRVLAIALTCFLFVACESKPALLVPDIFEVDESTAKNILSSSSLIPVIKYEYNDSVDDGLVIKTSPDIGSEVDKNAKVTVFISQGPVFIQSTNSTISWWHVTGSSNDDWEFYSPTINEGVLEIDVKPTIRSRYSFEWRLFGTASVTDTFDKTVPIRMESTGDGRYLISVPLADLDVKKPTTLSLKLSVFVNNNPENVRIDFSISWPK